ncbi:hypothetical protein [Cupriavidus plantarum]|uniref:hypothetical protein n=1 Tax=Cupriavidus plantarum TaxID=942865 RepID=UPI00217CD3BA|nr:hypothetical protein [Cupriavidus plantarum]
MRTYGASFAGANGARELAEYPDGAIELWADDTSLPYTTHYRYPDVDQAAIVENKRLGHVLGIAQKVQALRGNRHYEGPSRTMSGVPPGPQPVTRARDASDKSTASIWSARCVKVRWPRCRTMTRLRSYRMSNDRRLPTLSGLSVFPLAVIRRSLPSGRIATDSQKLDNASHHLIEICTFRMRTIL